MNAARNCLLALAGVISLRPNDAAVAQNVRREPDPLEDFLEIAPPEAALPTFVLDQLLLAGSSLDRADLKSVISETSRPDTSLGPIGVCFVDGDPALFDDVIRFAKAWEIGGTSVQFDFGTAATRYCQPNAKQLVRISFSGKGTWSVIGLEGRLAKGATMNFSSLESWKLVSKRKFQRAVQHEFGHALGLYHEHQNPDERCDLQIDWAEAGKLYRGKGFNLSDEEIKRNIGVLTVKVRTSAFDPDSIMLYDLPSTIFRSDLFYFGQKPTCYVGRINYLIAPQDISAIQKYYPSNPGEVRLIRQAAFERSRAAFKATVDGRVAMAIVSSYFPFADEADAKPYVAYAQDALSAKAKR